MSRERHSVPRLMVACAAAALVAVAAAFAFLLLSFTLNEASQIALIFLILGFPIALLHVLLLGLPAYAILRERWPLRWWNAAIAGFAIGVLPFGIFTFDPSAEFLQAGQIVFVEGGQYTQAGWLNYLQGLAVAGAFGIAGGLAFWLVLRENKKGDPLLDRPSLSSDGPSRE